MLRSVNITTDETSQALQQPVIEIAGQIKIETGVPFPTRARAHGPTRLPFDKLLPGMSFFVPLEKVSFQKGVTRVQVATTRWRYRFPDTTWITHVSHDEGGIRVWRLT
jgi:hypothetical protein